MLRYIQEIEDDDDLMGTIAAGVSKQRRGANAEMPYGRRLGWYALVRALKPRFIVETGVDKGLGACVLTAALRRNAADESEGRYIGTDINPEAGYLLRGEYARYGEIREEPAGHWYGGAGIGVAFRQ